MPVGHKPGMRLKGLVRLGATPEDCWEWTGSVNARTGYGKKQWHGETWLAHRWVWMMLLGPIPEDQTVDHLCSNRRCVNPHHLEIVSQATNSRRGKSTKLSKEQAEEIRNMEIGWGERQSIADQYGVSPQTITDIRLGRSWN